MKSFVFEIIVISHRHGASGYYLLNPNEFPIKSRMSVDGSCLSPPYEDFDVFDVSVSSILLIVWTVWNSISINSMEPEDQLKWNHVEATSELTISFFKK